MLQGFHSLVQFPFIEVNRHDNRIVDLAGCIGWHRFHMSGYSLSHETVI